MRSMVWGIIAVALSGVVAGAMGLESESLIGGVLIVHAPPGITYSIDPPEEGWCQHYLDSYAITASEEQNARIDATQPETGSVWYVLGAWQFAKEFCGVEFGFGSYESEIYIFDDHGPCYPEAGMELPTAGWPGPNEGTQVVPSGAGDHWSGNYVPIYYFTGYAYGSQGQIPLSFKPSGENFGGFGNCDNPISKWEASCFGAVGINTAGIECHPELPPLEYACCLRPPEDEGGAECQVLTQEACNNSGGEWQEGIDMCCPNPCPTWWACCVDNDCYFLTEEDCTSMSGTWYPGPRFGGAGGYLCEYTCEELGDLRACCLQDVCFLVWEDECTSQGATWHADWTTCDPNPCSRVCCVEDVCFLAWEGECTDALGQWHPEWNSCDPNPCEPAVHVCCVGAVCSLITQEECTTMGGTWYIDGDSCDPNPCEPAPVRVCCMGDSCSLVMEIECTNLQGTWHPDWTTCDPNPCDTPVKRVTWSRIKALYR